MSVVFCFVFTFDRVRMSDIKLAPGLVSTRPLSNFIFVTCKKITAELGAAKTEED
jgi:hypothetical protein